MKIGIISSRTNSARSNRSGVCEDDKYLIGCFDKVFKILGMDNEVPITVISGGGRGPETLAKDYADEHDYQYTVIPPRSKVRGAMAFPERNTAIISVSDALIVFWGGEDMYIANTLSEAMFMDKPVFVFPI